MIRPTRAFFALLTAVFMLIQPVHATDVVESTILAHDRIANVIVLKDKTVWPLDLLTSTLPEGLQAGDEVEIRYQSNEDDGLQTIHSIVLLDQ